MLPGMGDFDPPDAEPDPVPQPDECPGCRHEFDPESRPVNDETGRCTTCDPWYCYGCHDVVVTDRNTPCDACGCSWRPCLELRLDGISYCAAHAKSEAESCMAWLRVEGEILARKRAEVDKLSAEIEEVRNLRQRYLDAIHNHETEKTHAA